MKEPSRLLTFADLRARGLVRNREGLRQMIARLGFPAGFMISENRRVFDEAAVEVWLDQRRAASGQPGAAPEHVGTPAS